ncbi:hypothetical protein FQZ97_897090 [compost metagenome]
MGGLCLAAAGPAGRRGTAGRIDRAAGRSRRPCAGAVPARHGDLDLYRIHARARRSPQCPDRADAGADTGQHSGAPACGLGRCRRCHRGDGHCHWRRGAAVGRCCADLLRALLAGRASPPAGAGSGFCGKLPGGAACASAAGQPALAVACAGLRCALADLCRGRHLLWPGYAGRGAGDAIAAPQGRPAGRAGPAGRPDRRRGALAVPRMPLRALRQSRCRAGAHPAA